MMKVLPDKNRKMDIPISQRAITESVLRVSMFNMKMSSENTVSRLMKVLRTESIPKGCQM